MGLVDNPNWVIIDSLGQSCTINSTSLGLTGLSKRMNFLGPTGLHLAGSKGQIVCSPNDKKLRKFNLTPHLPFKFIINATIACYVTFFSKKLLSYPHFLLLSFLFVKKRRQLGLIITKK